MQAQIKHTLPDNGYVRMSQLATNKAKGIVGILPFGSSWIWTKQSIGEFPKPVKVSARVTVWRVEDVRAYLKARGLEA